EAASVARVEVAPEPGGRLLRCVRRQGLERRRAPLASLAVAFRLEEATAGVLLLLQPLPPLVRAPLPLLLPVGAELPLPDGLALACAVGEVHARAVVHAAGGVEPRLDVLTAGLGHSYATFHADRGAATLSSLRPSLALSAITMTAQRMAARSPTRRAA